MKWLKLIKPINYSASTYGQEIAGLVSDVEEDIVPQRLRYTPRTLWVEEKNPPVLHLKMSRRFVMDAILALPPTLRSTMFGKLSDSDKMGLISLGWRVTSTSRKTEN